MHSRFGISIPILPTSTCNVKKTQNGQNLDEIPNTELIRIPDSLLTPPESPETPQTLIDIVLPYIFSGIFPDDSAILAPENIDCDIINSIAIRKLNEETEMTTLNSVVKNEDGMENMNNNLYRTEFLNSLAVN